MSAAPELQPLASEVTDAEKDHIVALANQQLGAAMESLPVHMRRAFVDCTAVLCLQLMHTAYSPEYATTFLRMGLNEYTPAQPLEA